LKDLSTIIKLKKQDFGKEQNLVEHKITFQNWFPIDPSFQLLKSEDKNEDKDTSSTEMDPNLKHKGLEPSHQGEPIDLDSPPHMQ
jgi:hypothetical protein